MKQHYMAWAICLLFVCQHVWGQPASSSGQGPKKDFVYAYGATAFTSDVPLNEICPKAFRYFLKNYPTIRGERWSSFPKGMSVSFSDSLSSTRVVFDIKGRFVLSDKAYAENGLSPSLKKELYTLFPGYKVQTVVESFDGRQLSYAVIMRNGGHIKSIEMHGPEVRTVDEFATGAVAGIHDVN